MFETVSKCELSGDQPQAIDEIVKGVEEGKKVLIIIGFNKYW